MSGAPNPLSEMGNLQGNVVSGDARPNPSFAATVLPGFKKAVQSRRAIRIFDGAAIPEDVMWDCFEDAVLAPSASNLQCYEMYWVRDAAKKARLAELCLDQPGAKTAGELVVVVSRVDLWESHLNKLKNLMTNGGQKPLKGAVRGCYEDIVPMLLKTDRWGFHNLKRRIMFWLKSRSSPTVNGPVSRADHRIYGHIQACLVAENFMLSLAAHGYECCPMRGIDGRGIGNLLQLPATAEVTMVIGAGNGMPHGLFSKRVRFPIKDLVKEA